MGHSRYSTNRPHHKRFVSAGRRGEWITIPNARAVKESAKALCCDFHDNTDHWIPNSQIAPHSEVHHVGDRGVLIITGWLAQTADLVRFATTQSPWARLPHTRQRLQELHDTLKPDDPARAIVKSITDELRKDLGIAPAERGGSDGGKHEPSTTT